MKLSRLFIVVMLLGLLTSFLIAQEKKEEAPQYGWKNAMVGGFNLSQTSFSNWAAGGENSLAWQLNLNFNFTQDMKKTNWANNGKFTYGHTKVSGQASRKSIDEIKLESVFTYKLGIYVNPFVAATGESQFGAGYKYEVGQPSVQISKFLDPGYFRESAGVGYEPNKIVKTRLGVALKQTLTSDYPVPFADDPKTTALEKTRNEIGAESVTDVNWKITETNLLTSKLELFSNLKAVDEIDVKWDNILTSKISKYFNFNVNFLLFYDKDISKKRQIKQAIAVGISYAFL
jgi:hypothetical protein